jgi:hypothetical protein
MTCDSGATICPAELVLEKAPVLRMEAPVASPTIRKVHVEEMSE